MLHLKPDIQIEGPGKQCRNTWQNRVWYGIFVRGIRYIREPLYDSPEVLDFIAEAVPILQ